MSRKEKHGWFKKKEVEQPVEEEEEVIPTFKRRSRVKEEEKVATAAEVKEVIKPSIFGIKAESEKEYDYLEKKASVQGSLYQDDALEDTATETKVQAIKKIADAFEFTNYEEIDDPTERVSLFDFGEEPEPEDPFAALTEEESGAEESEEESEESEEQKEPEEQEELEEQEEPAHKKLDRSGLDVLERLKVDTEDFRKRSGAGGEEYCCLDYANDSVPDVVSEGGKMKLPTYRVYVNGVEKQWDRLFEVKVPAGAVVEVETGVSLTIPKDASLELQIEDSTLEKYNLRMPNHCKTTFSSTEVLDPLVVSFIAREGAYLSKVGRVIECQIVA